MNHLFLADGLTSAELELHVNTAHKELLSPGSKQQHQRGGSCGQQENEAANPPGHCPFTDSDSGEEEEDRRGRVDRSRSPGAGGQSRVDRSRSPGAGGPGGHITRTRNTSFHTDAELTRLETETPDLRPGTGNVVRAEACPVCGQEVQPNAALISHVETHFTDKKAAQADEARQFAALQAEYGMDDVGSYTTQGRAVLQRAVRAGQLSVLEYHEQTAVLAQESHRSSRDDGGGRTENITALLEGRGTALAAPTDHFSSGWGDRGWGCGYRNLQMVLSCLVRQPGPRAALASRLGPGMPSIASLQAAIEAAWREGFDQAGRQQLGGRLLNTRKWIGATEVWALLSYCGLQVEIVDFHRSTGPGGTHPLLFRWAENWFRVAGRAPLFLQHQGHSRTVAGVEGGAQPTLLVLDPSHRPASLLATPARLVRKTLAGMKHMQYQVVAVRGLLQSHAGTRKEVISTRQPPN